MAQSKKKQPNILVIFGDDIGITNLSCYSHGLMGYQTPNIDRIAKEGMMFTDSYGEQSCTAGRSSFITGQSVLRTGLSKVGMPGAPIGMTDKAVTIAALLNVQYRQLPGGEFNHSTVITLLSPLGVVETSSSKLGTPDPALVAKLGD